MAAAKRNASSDLNHDNWDREEEREEAGTFQKASEEALRRRVIKTARRRNPLSSATEEGADPKKSAFGSFTGFGKSAPAVTGGNSFGFLSSGAASKANDASTAEPKTNGVSQAGPALFKMSEGKAEKSDDKSNEYYAKLKGLNESVSQWIKKHVDANPFISLQPVFRDYEKYLGELEEKERCGKSGGPSAAAANSLFKFAPKAAAAELISQPSEKKGEDAGAAKSTAPATTGLLFGKSAQSSSSTAVGSFVFNKAASTSVSTTSTPTFNFGAPVTSSAPMFNFGNPAATSSSSSSASSSLFSFGNKNTQSATTAGETGAPSPAAFSFGVPNHEKPPGVSDKTEGGAVEGGEAAEETDEPPKVEFTPVVEEGHVYTVRCKVFVKKDGSYGDRGVGNLFLKPVPETGKTQLIVRADTNLGNLLLNLILSPTIPIQRVGTKDVMLACLPTPDAKPPPVPVLLRVKTPDEADRLCTTLKDNQK